MYCKFKKAIQHVAREGFHYAIREMKNCYPWLQSKKERANKRLKRFGKEHVDDMQNTVLEKYEEAKQKTRKAEKAAEKERMNSIRNTIIGTTLGFGAGAVTGYVLVKKSQIKESDYVFSDDEVIENTNFNNAPIPPMQAQAPVQMPPAGNAEQKNYTDFNEKYKISEDGTTLIKK